MIKNAGNLENKKQSLPLKEVYFPVFIILAVVILGIFFLLPKIKQIIAQKAQIDSQKVEINKLIGKLQDLKTLSEADLYNSESLLLEALPQEKNFYGMLVQTKQIFEENGAFLNSFDLSPGLISTQSAQKTDDNSTLLSMKLAFNASYLNFSDILEDFSRVLPLIEVEKIDFTNLSSTPSASLPDLEGTMSLKTFFSPLPKTLGKIDEPLPKIDNNGNTLIQELAKYNRFSLKLQASEESATETVVVGKDNPFP